MGNLQYSTLSFTQRANFSLIQIFQFSLLVWISHFSCADARISHFWFEFLTFGHLSSKFLTFGSNFSLLATFPVKFSLFQRISHSSSRPHSHAGRPTPTPPALFVSPAQYHFGPPNDIAGWPTTTPALPMTWLIPCYWRAGARQQITAQSAGVQKVRNSNQKSTDHRSECRRAKSEKFKPKVRNLWNCAGKVRNSNQKWEKKNFNMCISEKFAR